MNKARHITLWLTSTTNELRQNRPTRAFLPRKEYKIRSVLVAVASVLGLLVANGHSGLTDPCGHFSFTGSNTNGSENILTYFSFDPGHCGSTCQCDTICYIQIVRVFDSEGYPQFVTEEQYSRRVRGQTDWRLNDWYIDNNLGDSWGYYGMRDDGTLSPNDSSPGSNTVKAVLSDLPYPYRPGSVFEAMDVPVCISPKSGCVNYLLGYYYYSFNFEANGLTDKLVHENAPDWYTDAVDLAVKEWNNVAKQFGKNAFPTPKHMKP